MLFHTPTDVLALKGSYFNVSNSALNVSGIFQKDLLCIGAEENLLKCNNNGIGAHMCPEDHSEDAGVKCNGTYVGILIKSGVCVCVCMEGGVGLREWGTNKYSVILQVSQ